MTQTTGTELLKLVLFGARLTPSQLDQVRRDAIAADCPMPDCTGRPGEPCTYSMARRDNETDELIRPVQMLNVARSCHLERVAVYTERRVYDYTLRRLEQRP